MQVAVRDCAGVDAEPVAGPDTAREALGEVLAAEADVAARSVFRLGKRHGPRDVDAGCAGASLGHEHLAIEQEHAVSLLGHGQRAIERRRQA